MTTNKKIYKYVLNYYSVPEYVELPVGAQVIDYQIQNKQVVMWAMVESEKTEKRVFMVAFTGKEIPYEILATHGSRIIEETGIVIHLLELDKDTKASDPRQDDRLKS